MCSLEAAGDDAPSVGIDGFLDKHETILLQTIDFVVEQMNLRHERSEGR